MPDTDEITTVEITVDEGTVLLVAEIMRIERGLDAHPYEAAHEAIHHATSSLIAKSKLLKGTEQ